LEIALMFPTLSLRLNRSTTQSWSHHTTSKDPRTGAVLDRAGTRIEQGWRLTMVNGIVLAGPFQRVYDLGVEGGTRLFGAKANAARHRFLQQNSGYRRAVWGRRRRALAAMAALLCTLFAALATLVTLPVFLVVWLLWAVVVGFWAMALAVVRLVAPTLLRSIGTKDTP
jgi:hypothetical protein